MMENGAGWRRIEEDYIQHWMTTGWQRRSINIFHFEISNVNIWYEYHIYHIVYRTSAIWRSMSHFSSFSPSSIMTLFKNFNLFSMWYMDSSVWCMSFLWNHFLWRIASGKHLILFQTSDKRYVRYSDEVFSKLE